MPALHQCLNTWIFKYANWSFALAGSDVWGAGAGRWTGRAEKHPPIALSSSYPNIVRPFLIGNEKQMVPSISFYEMGELNIQPGITIFSLGKGSQRDLREKEEKPISIATTTPQYCS